MIVTEHITRNVHYQNFNPATDIKDHILGTVHEQVCHGNILECRRPAIPAPEL